MKLVMERMKKITTCGWITIFMVAGLILSIVYIYATHGEGWKEFLFYSNVDTGNDFFHSIEYTKGRMPYQKFKTLYPPLANLFYYLLYCLVPEWQTSNWGNSFYTSLVMVGSENDLRHWQPTMMLFIIYIMVTSLCLYTLFEKYLSKYKTGKLLSICLMFSAGMLFAMERGNIITFVFLLIMIYVSCRNSANKVISELALISLAIAAGLKIYPAIFGILLVYDKQWKKAIRTVIYGILSFILPFFAFKEGFIEGVKIFLDTLLNFTSVDNFQANGFAMANIFNSLTYIIDEVFNYDLYLEGLVKYASILNYGSVLLLLICGFFLKKDWERVLVCSLAVVLYSTQSVYILVVLIVPLLKLLQEEEQMRKSNAMVIVGLLLTQILLPTHKILSAVISGQTARQQLGIMILILYILSKVYAELRLYLKQRV